MDHLDRTPAADPRTRPIDSHIHNGDAELTVHQHLARVALTLPAVSASIGVGRRLVKRLVETGELPAVTLGGRTYVLRHALDTWLSEPMTSQERERQ